MQTTGIKDHGNGSGNRDTDNNNNNNNNTNNNSGGRKEIKFSFGINNNNTNKQNSNNSNSNSQSLFGLKKRKETEDEANYITELEGTTIKSLKPEVKLGPKVIPLTEQKPTNAVLNERQVKPPSEVQSKDNENKKIKTNGVMENNANGTTTTTTTTTSTTTKQDEKMKDDDTFNPSRNGLQVKHKSQPIKQEIRSIVDSSSTTDTQPKMKLNPLIEKLQGLDDYKNEKDKFKYDVDSRPEEASLDDFEETPIEVFGEAMLRGMGWKPGEGIGLSNNQNVQPVQFVKRAGNRLGLGATPADVADKNMKYMSAAVGEDGKVRHVVGLDEKLVPMKFGLQVGDQVTVIQGVHEGMNATVESFIGEDKLLIIFKSNEKDVVDKSDVQILERVKSKQTSQQQQNTNNNNSNGKNSNNSNNKNSDNRYNEKVEPTWIRPNIVVKIVSKSLGDGRYYNKKATIIDIVGDQVCVLELDNGKVLEDVKQRMLETAIPRPNGSCIIVAGSKRGKIGKMIDRRMNSRGTREIALVQLSGDLSILEFELDDICQYVGSDNHH